MDRTAREKSITELKKERLALFAALFVALLIILGLVIKLVTQSEILHIATPGLPNDTIIERTAMDKGAQRATLIAVTGCIVQVNPSNVKYNQECVKTFLSPQAYTKVSLDMEKTAKQLEIQHELGSYYMEFRRYKYDPVINKHFLVVDVHTVNAAKDTALPFVYEYEMHVENYRPVVDSVVRYEGINPRDSEWLNNNKKQ